MSEFPVQLSKVQAPSLRDQTLARDRLLDWLAAKIHDRVILVIAEAGYGKTTLLADFARRTRLRSLWYRLDRGDRDWVGFIAHLAAAVRVHVPEFGAATDSLLRETATTAPPLDTVLDTFLRELVALPPDPTVLIFDDFHLVDDNHEIRHVAKELLARAPERLTFIFASRHVPPLPLARLRALGEVAELRTDDLRFDPAETERLFRETYEMPLESSLITELSRRTEGWAASLQLVRAALHDRDAVQARAFIGSLSGAEGHLYDYLAEEVIGDLPEALQDFLMRTSILETIDPDLAAVASGVSTAEARQLIAEAETMSLVSRRGLPSKAQVRAHPLVREFLQARLARAIGDSELRRLHLVIARAVDALDWRTSASHYRAAGATDLARHVVLRAIDGILATGSYATAKIYLGDGMAEEGDASPAFVLGARMAIIDANPARALALAEKAIEADPSSAAAAITLITSRSYAGDVAGAASMGHELEQSSDQRFSRLGRAMRVLFETSVAGSIPAAEIEVAQVLDSLESADVHYRGIAQLNRASILVPTGNFAPSLEAADLAIRNLQGASGRIELQSARLNRVVSLAFLGRLAEGRAEGEVLRREVLSGQRVEVAGELGWIEVALGDEEAAKYLLDEIVNEIDAARETGQHARLVEAMLALRMEDAGKAALALAVVLPRVPSTTPAFEARRLVAAALLSHLQGNWDQAMVTATDAYELANAQGADLWATVARLIAAMCGSPGEINHAIRETVSRHPIAISIVAEVMLRRLLDLDGSSVAALSDEAQRRPDRWRASLRRVLADHKRVESHPTAARLLATVGTVDDLSRLRAVEHGYRGTQGLVRELARRLAARVVVEDLGRVRIRIGDRIIEGAQLRRKVLALLCFLISREGFSATRDEVLENLWPDVDPASALNSLNQTVYFLRRVFEPKFSEDKSPGYVHQDSETIWLDVDLIDSRSRICRSAIREAGRHDDPAVTMALVDSYSGPFALDFAYEEWASAFRDSLHASYLHVIEHRVAQDMNEGHFGRAIAIAERATQIEPDSEELQASLVRLYRLAGAHAAAAEQYARYSASLRTIGVDPPTFDAVVSRSDPIGTPAY